MPSSRIGSKSRAAVSNALFGTSVVILIIVAALGFGLYATSLGHASTSEEAAMGHGSASSEMMITTTSSNQNGTCACEFVPQSGAMISNAWLLSAPLSTGGYAVSIHAEGLKPNGTYLVQVSLSKGSMQIVPISNASMTMSHDESASEFQSNENGTGQFWIEVGNNPMSTFEAIDLVFLPGMSMQNATVVATLNPPAGMSGENSMMMTTTTNSMTSENMSG